MIASSRVENLLVYARSCFRQCCCIIFCRGVNSLYHYLRFHRNGCLNFHSSPLLLSQSFDIASLPLTSFSWTRNPVHNALSYHNCKIDHCSSSYIFLHYLQLSFLLTLLGMPSKSSIAFTLPGLGFLLEPYLSWPLYEAFSSCFS